MYTRTMLREFPDSKLSHQYFQEKNFKIEKLMGMFSLNNLHRYTKRSVKKFVCLHVLLLAIVVSLGINSKEELQKIAEW